MKICHNKNKILNKNKYTKLKLHYMNDVYCEKVFSNENLYLFNNFNNINK